MGKLEIIIVALLAVGLLVCLAGAMFQYEESVRNKWE
jgi:hypothetical protein